MSYVAADKAESELATSIKKATSIDETAPKQKHVRSTWSLFNAIHPLTDSQSCLLECIVYTWDHRTSGVIWSILKVQPILSDEVQTFKALIMVHKIIKDGHPIVSIIVARTGLLVSPDTVSADPLLHMKQCMH